MAMGGGSAADDGRGFGGFGGLGIGNPGSYGGQQSVGAPGFGGGYGGGVSGGGQSAAVNDINSTLGYNAAIDFSGPVSDGVRSVTSAALESALADYDASKPEFMDYAKTVLSVANAIAQLGLNPMADSKAIEAIGDLRSKDKAARDAAKSKMREAGITEDKISEFESQMSPFEGSAGGPPTGNRSATDFRGRPAGGTAGGGLELGSNVGTPPGGVSMSGNSLTSQVNGLFGGDNPQFDLNTLMQDYTQGVEQAGGRYQAAAQDLKGLWQKYLDDFDNRYASIDKEYGGVLDRYKNQVDSIPQMSLKLPGKMGGGSFALAPKNWNDVYSQQAQTSGNILGQRANMLTPWANTQQTGIQQQGLADANALTQQLNALQQAKMTPFHYGYETYDRDKQLENKTALAEMGQPNAFDRWAPIVSDFVTSEGGQDLIGQLSDWAKSWDW